ncbi:MAG: hypothetical protein Q8873_09270, partial [Bacillota bacterium]|nr:hypothetical protein [Bacillota bacterium]
MKKVLAFFLLATTVLMTFSLQALAANYNVEDAAVYATDKIDFSGSSSINGDAVIVGGSITSPKKDYRCITGTVYKTDAVSVKNKALSVVTYTGTPVNYENLDTSVFPDSTYFAGNAYADGSSNLTIGYYSSTPEIKLSNYTLTENAFINNLEVSNGLTMNISAPANTVRVLRVKNLTVNGYINITGSGKVLIYVDNLKSCDNSYINQNGSSANMCFIIKNTNA